MSKELRQVVANALDQGNVKMVREGSFYYFAGKVVFIGVTGGIIGGHVSTSVSYAESEIPALLPGKERPALLTGSNQERQIFVSGVKVKDKFTGEVYKGTVNVKPTIDRIKAGINYPHHHDGTVFKNLEQRLPIKLQGYYREYVHPTPGINVVGPQRIVIGQGGEIYYTPDHYETFIRIK
jgi:guanyl-specific ribonuclease Sa